jgi:hypothetical protein
MDVLVSTRTAVVLLTLIAAALVAGTVLENAAARRYVYGRLWFHVLLGLLGLDLLACMLRRGLRGWSGVWGLLTHAGILLVLLGATVTLTWAERGAIVLAGGEQVDSYVPEGLMGQGKAAYAAGTRAFTDPAGRFVTAGVSQGDRVVYLHRKWEVESVTDETNLLLAKGPEKDVAVGREYYIEGKPVALGSVLKLIEFRLTYYPPVDYLLVTRRDGPPGKLRLEPSRAVDIPGTQLRIAGVKVDHPTLIAEVRGPSGAAPIRLVDDSSSRARAPWDADVFLVYRRERRIKEFESEVEVIEEGKGIRRHVIRVNSPLVHNGTKLSQSDCDMERLRWTLLSVSRDSGVWFVYAGYVAMAIGLTGRFYVAPLLRARPARRAPPGPHQQPRRGRNRTEEG